MNEPKRITKPLLKVDGSFEEISFEKAYDVILDEIKHAEPEENAFYAGSRLSNEEIYLIQKLARVGANTNNVYSFQYLNALQGTNRNYKANVPFDDIHKASKIYLIGSEINEENGVASFMVNKAQTHYQIPVESVTNEEHSSMSHKVDQEMKINSYYHFVKAVNHYILSQNLQNNLFIKDKCDNYEEYKNQLLKENFDELIEKSGVCCKDHLIEFAENYNKEQNAVIIFSERNISPRTGTELFNLAMMTGKMGKTASGLLSLKEKNNSQGIFDMGVGPNNGVGGQSLENSSFSDKLKKVWGIDKLPELPNKSNLELLDKGIINKMYIFGEDPIGCAIDNERVEKWFGDADFIMVQDYFFTETAKEADLILPATMPLETSGTFTNTIRYIQQFDKQLNSNIEKENYQQLLELMKNFDVNGLSTPEEIRKEAISLLPENLQFEYTFEYTEENNNNFRLFKHGCDAVVKYFDDEQEKAFSDKEKEPEYAQVNK
jgi:formate dehydrogenase major subunit